VPVKVGTHNHVKMKRLKRLLGVPLYRAVGILECLWLLCCECCDEGDIGKFSDDEIADYLEWDGDVSELVRCLSDSGWIDPDTTLRLVVHDWMDHAPEYIRERVRKRRAREGKARKQRTYVRPKSDNNGHGRDTPPLVPSIPNPTNPIPTSQSDAEYGGMTDRTNGDVFMAGWNQVAAALTARKAARWQDAIRICRDQQCTPDHALALIEHGSAKGYDIGGIIHRLKLAHPGLAVDAAWPEKPKAVRAAESKTAGDRDKAAKDVQAREIIRSGRKAQKPESDIHADLAAAGLTWPS
jgi:hypothetical protein